MSLLFGIFLAPDSTLGFSTCWLALMCTLLHNETVIVNIALSRVLSHCSKSLNLRGVMETPEFIVSWYEVRVTLGFPDCGPVSELLGRLISLEDCALNLQFG